MSLWDHIKKFGRPVKEAAKQGPPFAQAFQRALEGVKILFGGANIAEVRVNGEAHEAAPGMLRGLDWPRLEQPGFLRTYVIALYRE